MGQSAGKAGDDAKRLDAEPDRPVLADRQGPFPIHQHAVQLRVRFQETDAQGHCHHATYPNYFEVARLEMLRQAGLQYRDLEESGTNLVVTDLHCQYFAPALYDDLLTVTIRVTKTKGVRIHHEYEIHRDETLIVKGSTVVAAVDADGNVKRLPNWLKLG